MSETTQKAPMDLGTPATQSGVVPDLPSDVGPQSRRIAADPVLFADPPSGASQTPIQPDSAPYGAGSLGADAEGWHPGTEDAA